MIKPEKREEIIRAALELITEHGFQGAPMAMIAERAGVGAGTIYRYFENKDVLINELFREVHDKARRVLLKGYEAQRPIRERFLHLGTTLLTFFIENPLVFRYLEQYHNSPYGVEFRRDKILGNKEENDLYTELFNEGVSRQVMKDLPLVILFGLAFGPLLAVMRDHILGFITLNDSLIARTVSACWDGVKREGN